MTADIHIAGHLKANSPTESTYITFFRIRSNTQYKFGRWGKHKLKKVFFEKLSGVRHPHAVAR